MIHNQGSARSSLTNRFIGFVDKHYKYQVMRPCINSDFEHWCQNCRAPLGAPTSAGRLRLLGGGVVEGRGPGQGPGVTRSLRAMTADTARGAPVAEYIVMMYLLSISKVFGKLITSVSFC